MLDRRWRGGVERGLKPLGEQLRRIGVSPDALTVFGLLRLGRDRGAHRDRTPRLGRGRRDRGRRQRPARRRDRAGSGQASPRGAFFDSVADRASDALLLGGCAWWLAGESAHLPVLAFAVAAFSMIISYERARAEALGINARGGLMERAERFVFLSIGLAFGILVPVLWVMLVLTAFTAARPVPARVPAGRSSAAHARDDPPDARRERRTPARARATGGRRGGSTATAAGGIGPPGAAPARSRSHMPGRFTTWSYRAAAAIAETLPPRRRRAPGRCRGQGRAAVHAGPPRARRAAPAPCRERVGPRHRRGRRRRVRLVRALLVRDAAAPAGGPRRRGAVALHDRGVRAHRAGVARSATA